MVAQDLFRATIAFTSHPMIMTTERMLETEMSRNRTSDPADGGDHKREVGEFDSGIYLMYLFKALSFPKLHRYLSCIFDYSQQ